MTNSFEAVVACPECGGPTETRREGSSEGLFCTRCDWSVVTTHIPEILADSTAYEVRIRDGDYQNQQHVKAVANVASLNFLAARGLLQEAEPLVFRGKARDVARVRDTLVNAGMLFTINPTFPW